MMDCLSLGDFRFVFSVFALSASFLSDLREGPTPPASDAPFPGFSRSFLIKYARQEVDGELAFSGIHSTDLLTRFHVAHKPARGIASGLFNAILLTIRPSFTI